MTHDDVVVHEEEEDLQAAIQKLEIPYKELEQNAFDSTDDGLDGLKEFIEDPDLLLYDLQESEDPTSIHGRSLVPKRPRNKQVRRKRLHFNSASSLIGHFTNKICSHCETRNTPLWRAGPKGSGTLCNACGMRYKKGGLLPEYRPASSPGFKPNVHSNFHRKVMEIRREKNPPNNSFGFQH